VTVNGTTGVMSGTPAAGTGGIHDVTLTASNGWDTDDARRVRLYVHGQHPVGPVVRQRFTATVQ
jgi:hypothetical protein